MIITYKYRLKNASYARRLRRHSISLNQVWNYCAALQRSHEKAWKESAPKKSWPSEYDLNKVTAGTSKELDTHAGSIHEINRFFVVGRDKKKRAPRYRKSFGPKRSLGWVPFRASDRKISGNSIRYHGKTYRWFKDTRELPAVIKGGVFVEDSQNRWWVCLQVEVVFDQNHGVSVVGIDLGLKTLATLSSGEKIENPRAFRSLEAKLVMAQRAGKKRRSAAIHTKIKNIRNDHLHKETTRLIQSYSFIAVGDVSSAKLAKTRMAKSVLDAGWGRFKEMLRYKARRHGVEYLDVNEKYSSQACSGCRRISGSSPKGMGSLGMREWVCLLCGASHDRDVNAAKNILATALSARRPVEGIGGSFGN